MQVTTTIKLEIECTAQELAILQRIACCFSVSEVGKRINVSADILGGEIPTSQWVPVLNQFQQILKESGRRSAASLPGSE